MSIKQRRPHFPRLFRHVAFKCVHLGPSQVRKLSDF